VRVAFNSYLELKSHDKLIWRYKRLFQIFCQNLWLWCNRPIPHVRLWLDRQNRKGQTANANTQPPNCKVLRVILTSYPEKRDVKSRNRVSSWPAVLLLQQPKIEQKQQSKSLQKTSLTSGFSLNWSRASSVLLNLIKIS